MPTIHLFLQHGRRAVDQARRMLGWYQSESKIARDAQQYWSSTKKLSQKNAHWRGRFSDEVWLALGEEHMSIYEQFCRSVNFERPAKSIIEWGCGGGANAIRFSREAENYFGVDVSKETLDECQNQLAAAGYVNFNPVLIEASDPEAALRLIPHRCDFFLCTYVFELIPTPEYGLRILKIAHQLLRDGGMAMIQIKYATDTLRTQPRRWGYRYGVADMTTYRLEEFWERSVECGFKPRSLVIVPKQPLVCDERYGYFLLTK